MFAAYARPRFVLLLRNENVKSRHYVQRHHETRKSTKVVCVGELFHPLPLFGLNWDLKSEEGNFSLSLFFLRLLLAHNHRSTRLLFFHSAVFTMWKMENIDAHQQQTSQARPNSLHRSRLPTSASTFSRRLCHPKKKKTFIVLVNTLFLLRLRS